MKEDFVSSAQNRALYSPNINSYAVYVMYFINLAHFGILDCNAV